MINKIRQYKISYKIYNFFNKKYLQHNVPLYKKYQLKKKYYSSISAKDFNGIDEKLNIYDLKNSKDFLKEDPNFVALDKKIQDSICNWSDNGYAIIESFMTVEEVDAINNEIDNLIEEGTLKASYGGTKYMFANRLSKFINEIGNGKMKQIVEVLLNKKVSLFQTINFKKGSQQRTHSDSLHMSTFPNGNLIAAWVALQDVTIDDGPLHYYPNSHNLPYFMNEDYDNVGTNYKLGDKQYSDYEDEIEKVIIKNNLERKVFLAKKGDVLIWHANLLHGGNKVNVDGNTRKSMVFHYLANNIICYHEITQRPSLIGKFNN